MPRGYNGRVCCCFPSTRRFRGPPPQAHLHLARLADARSPRPARRAARQVRRCRGEGAELLPQLAGRLVCVRACIFPCTRCGPHPGVHAGAAVSASSAANGLRPSLLASLWPSTISPVCIKKIRRRAGGRARRRRDSALGTMGTRLCSRRVGTRPRPTVSASVDRRPCSSRP